MFHHAFKFCESLCHPSRPPHSEAGAIGSRLTGAGWGGCAISMVPADRVDAFIAHVAEHYYATLESKPADQSTYLFATAPSSGARAIDLRHRGGSGRLSQDCTIA
jgi:galactokinase